MNEIVFTYWQSFWFTPTADEFLDPNFLPAKPLMMSDDRRAIMMPKSMFAGPVRFQVVVDADEAECVARFGPHDRFEGDFRGEACGYILADMNHFVPVLDTLQPGDYRAIVLRSGADAADWDRECDESNLRYLLMLQPKD